MAQNLSRFLLNFILFDLIVIILIDIFIPHKCTLGLLQNQVSLAFRGTGRELFSESESEPRLFREIS